MAALLSKSSLLIEAPSRRSPVAFSTGVPTVLRTRLGLLAPRTACQPCLGRRVATRASSGDEGKKVVYNTEFGYSRKDVFLICGGVLALGYALYYGLQAMGMEAGYAGNWVQLLVFMGICVGWVSTYIFRVATKQMTYVKQLEQYEEAVMRKRIDEMTEAELEQLAGEVEADKERRAARRQAAAAAPPPSKPE